jgi:hypothetical protein
MVSSIAVVTSCASIVTFLLGLRIHDFLVLFGKITETMGQFRGKIAGLQPAGPEMVATVAKLNGHLGKLETDFDKHGRDIRWIGYLGATHLTLTMVWFMAYLVNSPWADILAFGFPPLTVIFLWFWLTWLKARLTQLGAEKKFISALLGMAQQQGE